MILVLGGTTEGRKAVEVLEEAGKPYYYSTKTGEQDITLHHGQRVDGAMDADRMYSFCNDHGVRLLVDAAHPFAKLLHQTVAVVSETLGIPAVRYERIYPPHDEDIVWIDDYRQVPHDMHSLLATTGVQSISKLKWLEDYGVRVYYRILPRQSSIDLAHQQGASDDQLCYYEDGNSIDVDADAILLKESGVTGGFPEKVRAARLRNMRIIVLKRPEIKMKERFVWCDGPYGLRRAVERLLPGFFALRSGLTTGTCATAAAVAAILQRQGQQPREVCVVLPNGETIAVAVGYGRDYAYCTKEAGDDPDVTNGIEVRAQVEPSNHFEIRGGMGVGRFTLPGFDYPPGEAAINRGPRQMLRANIQGNYVVTISVPEGQEIAKRTFNPRLGIEGGLSIIGVSGIVKPFSEEAFIDSIRKCMTVAKASGSNRVVLGSGAKSERFLQHRYEELPRQAFVQYGNYIGQALSMASELQFPCVTLGVMLGKAVKLAEGQMDTHSRRGTMNPTFIAQMLDEADCSADVSHITLARELWEQLTAEELPRFTNIVINHCRHHCQRLYPDGELTILLIDDDGRIWN